MSGIKVEFLDTQYRMLPEIREFPSTEFYDGKLTDSVILQTRPIPKHLLFMKNSNLKFFDIKFGREDLFRYSYYNQCEVE